MFRQAPSFPYHDLGIVEDGNTASRAISKDAYVIWKGESYFASTDILQGATLEEDVNLTAIPDGVINGVVEALNNKYTQILAPIAFSNGNDVQLSDSIENYDEVYVEIYLNTPTGKRAACLSIPVLAIKNNGYTADNQYIVSGIGSVNISNSQLSYAIYGQVAFKTSQTLHMFYTSKTGWTGTMYIQVYAK